MAKPDIIRLPDPVLLLEFEGEDWLITPRILWSKRTVMCRVESSADGGRTYIPGSPIELRVQDDGTLSERTCRKLCRQQALSPLPP